jgi:hypothetical protein
MTTKKKLLLGMFICLFVLSAKVFGQTTQPEEFQPVYLVVTTAHWNENIAFENNEWLATEKEYFEKVTLKNDLIIGSGYYTHFFTPDNSEILFVSVFKNWDDIESSNAVTAKLIEEGWPDEAERAAFFEKQRAYYGPMHSDEIYTSVRFRKPLKSESKAPLVYYVKKNKRGDGGEGFKEFFDNVTMKNPYVKGYYTYIHGWGANSMDALEVFVYDSFCDIETSFKENQKLIEAHWPDEAERKAFFIEYNKLFAGHGDYIYQNVPELAK